MLKYIADLGGWASNCMLRVTERWVVKILNSGEARVG